jgi:hypothetical protein
VLLLCLGLILLSAVPFAQAQQPASLSSSFAVVQPLQSVPVAVLVPGYTGIATLVLYDARGAFAGSVSGPIADGVGTLNVTPRGALGPQWAALFVDGLLVAENGNLFRLEAQNTIATGLERFDAFGPMVQTLLLSDTLTYELDGRSVHGYRSPDSPLIWLRDHVYQGRGFRYSEREVKSALDAFQRAQYADGSLPDYLARPEFKIAAWRTPVEADVEFLYVQGVYEAWQMTGDDAWLRSHLQSLRKALNYTLRDPLRWDSERGLVRRPFTIDTWDFEYGPTTRNPSNGQPAPRHWIDERTIWGTFHGDNTGLAYALELMARIEARVGDPNLAAAWREIGAGIMQRLNALSWNGRFFLHHVPSQPFDVPGVDEAEQLSLSNAIALNRGVLTLEQRQAIIAEYLRRLETTPAFAEWFSIDPPFPPGAFGLAGRNGELPGEYVNGGIMPLVGGELARGAFGAGYESYGFNILERYWLRMLSRARSFLWYRPDGAEGVGTDATLHTDGWGATAMLGALVEGAAGIEDRGAVYRDISVSPRWPAAGDVEEALVVARYATSDAYVAYRWQGGYDGLSLQLSSSAERATLRLLLPPKSGQIIQVLRDGSPAEYTLETVFNSRYVVLEIEGGLADIQVSLSQ